MLDGTSPHACNFNEAACMRVYVCSSFMWLKLRLEPLTFPSDPELKTTHSHTQISAHHAANHSLPTVLVVLSTARHTVCAEVSEQQRQQ